jgi:sterol desaturase/sphingolipid hydroxylase (fatty acid hydroxylase superfamily)
MPAADETLFRTLIAAALAAAFALALGLERWRPHAALHPAWSANLGLFAIGTLLTRLACGACGWSIAAWANRRGVGLLPWSGAPAWLAAGFGAAALDAVSYAWHRANHRIPLLWRFHQVHHADASFHVSTALRFHPGELLLALPVRMAAIVALGVTPSGVVLFEIVFGVANLLEHGNFDLPARANARVQRVLVTPALHRAHHEARWGRLDSNYGTVFSLWDRAFRSFRGSSPADRFATGLPGRDPSSARSLAESLWLPFRAGRARPEPR